MKQFIGYRVLKTALGAALAVFLSQLIGLEYAANSGIIVILSIQSTKKKSRDLALQRLFATVIALAAGWAVFTLFGFQAASFGFYLILFIPVAARLGYYDAIVPCSVLVSHLLAVRSVAPAWLLNEFLQMVIGAGMGLLMNLHIPSLEEHLEKDLEAVEDELQNVLSGMAQLLRNPTEALPGEAHLAGMKEALERGRARARHELHNYPRGRAADCRHFLELRSSQYEILKHMLRYLRRLPGCDPYCLEAARVTEATALLLKKDRSLSCSRPDYGACRELFWSGRLPGSAREFESRASLHEYLRDLEFLAELGADEAAHPLLLEASRQKPKK